MPHQIYIFEVTVEPVENCDSLLNRRNIMPIRYNCRIDTSKVDADGILTV